MDKYAEGVKGEVSAKEFLVKNGFAILDTNVSFPGVGELDIVAKDGDVLAFIEVRTRSDNAFGHPLETLTKTKISKIVRASGAYLSEHKIKCSSYRYDVVSVFRGKTELLKDAFYAKW